MSQRSHPLLVSLPPLAGHPLTQAQTPADYSLGSLACPPPPAALCLPQTEPARHGATPRILALSSGSSPHRSFLPEKVHPGECQRGLPRDAPGNPQKECRYPHQRGSGRSHPLQNAPHFNQWVRLNSSSELKSFGNRQIVVGRNSHHSLRTLWSKMKSCEGSPENEVASTVAKLERNDLLWLGKVKNQSMTAAK
jgi:hypothetical protein